MDCGDLHKAFQALEILLTGTTMEMIQIYLHNAKEAPSVEGFLQFQPSNTYQMIKHLVLNYALAIVLQKIGDRHNNYAVHCAGRYRFMEFFYGFNHPWYQRIEYQDLKNKASYPKEVSDIRKLNLSYGISEAKAKKQGRDFVLEGKIKRQKMMASKGSDDVNMWQKISRCLDDVIEITGNINTELNLHDTDGVRKVDLSKEIFAWRTHLRQSKYLKSYRGEQSVYSISGEALSDNFLELPTQLKNCMKCYWQMLEEGVTPNLKELSVLKNLEDLLLYDGIEI